MPTAEIMRMAFGTPITPRGMTAGEVVSRKVIRKTLREAIGAGGDGLEERRAGDIHPVLAKLGFLEFIAKAAEIEKEAPFKSEAQRRKFHAMASRGEISHSKVKEWERETGKKDLPERLHRKAAGEKEAILQHLPWLTMAPGKSVGARLARGVGWGSIPGLSAAEYAKAPPPTERLRMSQQAEELLEMTKAAIEVHQHMPSSQDRSDPDVKKNSSNPSSFAASVPLGMIAPGTSGIISGPGSPSSKMAALGLPHLRSGRSGTLKHLVGDAPEHRAMSGKATEEAMAPALGGAHVQRPAI